MTPLETLGLKALHQFDPERAHGLSLTALKLGLAPTPGPATGLPVKIAGLDLLNPIGLAAGYDKNAEAITPLSKAGFGFIEVGAATPKPQSGNPKPRLFRLTEDRAVINRFGFNNEGMEPIARRLKSAKRHASVPVGLNLGANKDSSDRAADFAKVLRHCGPHVDFATVNVSSPNTEKLRDLQGAKALTALLEGVLDARGALSTPTPIFLKIAPDLSESEIAEIADVAKAVKIDGIIATNTTLGREGLRSSHKSEAGGLSGAPLFEHATRALAILSRELDGAMPIIGVGGVSSAQTAYAKIKAGASAIQLYSALVYQGLSLVGEIADGLKALLEKDGYTSLSDAVGTRRGDWL